MDGASQAEFLAGLSECWETEGGVDCEESAVYERWLAEALAAQPAMSNTGSANRIKVPDSLEMGAIGGGFDTVHVSLHGSFSAMGWEQLTDLLAYHVELAKKDVRKGVSYVKLPSGEVLTVHARGQKHGCYMPYSIEWRGLRLAIGRHRHYRETQPSVWVEFGSFELMTRGLRELWKDVQQLLKSVGYRHGFDNVARCDFAVDFAGLTVKDFVAAYSNDDYFCRARRSNTYREGKNTYSGLEFGRGKTSGRVPPQIIARLYDKELETRHSPEKRQFLMLTRWGGVVPRGALRVEFQCRGRALKELGIHTVDQLLAKCGDAVRYLCAHWLRFVVEGERAAGSGHTVEAAVTPEWRAVQEAFAATYGGEAPAQRIVRKLHVCFDVRAKSCLGALGSLITLRDPTGLRPQMEVAAEIIREYESFLADAVERKRLERGSPCVIEWRAERAIPPEPLDGIPY